MKITGLDGIVYGVDELDRCIEFWNDFGLTEQESNEDGARFTTADGASIVVRNIDDPTLPPTDAEGPTVREVFWGVDTPQTLDALADEIGNDQAITRDDDGTVHTVKRKEDPRILLSGSCKFWWLKPWRTPCAFWVLVYSVTRSVPRS